MSTSIKSIPIRGISNVPSDFLSTDGEAAFAFNLVHDAGCIAPFHPSAPRLVFSMPMEYEVVYLHQSPSYSNFIIRKQDGGVSYFYFIAADEEEFFDAYIFEPRFHNVIFQSDEPSVSFKSIGNILIVNDGSQMKYFRFIPERADGNLYRFLGSEIPFFNMQFSLEAVSYTEPSENNWGEESEQDQVILHDPVPYSGILERDEDIATFSNAAIGQANRFQSWCNENGYFSQPFFVRYAIRLYDGSLTRASAPILMVPTTAVNPKVSVVGLYNLRKKLFLSCVGVASRLKYKIDGSMLDAYADWADIVSSIDIFVSAPVYTYDQAGKVRDTGCPDVGILNSIIRNNDKKSMCDLLGLNEWYDAKSVIGGRAISSYSALNRGFSSVILPAFNGYDSISIEGSSPTNCWVNDASGERIVSFTLNGIVADTNISVSAVLPAPSIKVDRQLEDVSVFYLLDSLSLDSLSPEQSQAFRFLDVRKNYLDTLVQKEVLAEDYASHDRISAGFFTDYNQRLNLADISRFPFEGFPPETIFQTVSPDSHSGSLIVLKSIVVYIEDSNGSSSIVRLDRDAFLDSAGILSSWFFYPNANAKRVELYWMKDGMMYIDSRTLRRHKFIPNAAFCFLGLLGSPSPERFSGAIPSPDFNPVREPNVIYTSEVANPFVFRAENVTQVGTGRVIALVPQAVALSQGQFGQFPMTCFTTDGIWALSVSSTGGWSASQPFSRDVVLNADPGNILQLDRQIMFASDRGLMLISGSSVECISESLNGQRFIARLASRNSDCFRSICSMLSGKGIFDISSDALINVSFSEFISDAVFLYDYTHQRIIIGNPAYRFSYVFNRDDNVWTSIPMKLSHRINSYPECYAVSVAKRKYRRLVNLPDIVIQRSTGSSSTVITATVRGMSATEFKDKYGKLELIISNSQFQTKYNYGDSVTLTTGLDYTFSYSDGRGSYRSKTVRLDSYSEMNISFSREAYTDAKASDLIYSYRKGFMGWFVKLYVDGVQYGVKDTRGIVGGTDKIGLDTYKPGEKYPYNEEFFIDDNSILYFIYMDRDKNIWSNLLTIDTNHVSHNDISISSSDHLEYEEVTADCNLLVDFSREGLPPYEEEDEYALSNADNLAIPHDGFLFSRPVKLGDPASLKVLRTVNVQGRFNRGNVSIILLGCSDNAMRNWFILASSKGSRLPFRYGTAYKYFIICLVTHLHSGESVASVTVEYEDKETHKLHQ